MIKQLTLLLTCLLYINTYAQFGPQQLISTTCDEAESVFACDIDGDGDMDVLSVSYMGGQIAWYNNTDGQGTFSTQNSISTDVLGPYCVHASDIDGDGDMDVLSASEGDNKVSWYENTNGLGLFGVQQIISTDAIRPNTVFTADMDGDGDMDVLSASWSDLKIAWYENTDGLGTFGPQQILTTNANNASDVFAEDLDGDGDMDVLFVASWGDVVGWFENTDGQGTFGPQQTITTNVNEPLSVFATDIDGDGDMDVLSASSLDSKLAWYENTNGQGDFGPQQIIASNAGNVNTVYSIDLDGDGDMDVLSASYDDKIAWYENTNGQGNFSPLQIISTDASSPRSVFASDIDGDGNIDVLSASSFDNKIAWYENMIILGIADDSSGLISVYPNPTHGILTIESNSVFDQISIYNTLGQVVFVAVSITEGKETIIDISNLEQGIYFIKIKNEAGIINIKKIVKK